MTTTTYPTIMLPGPIMAAYSVTIRSETTNEDGSESVIRMSLQGDGRGIEQVLEALQTNYGAWHRYLGCEIQIDFGNGTIRRTLDERFGVFTLEQEPTAP